MNDGERSIKVVMAIVHPDKLSNVRTALAKVGTSSLTVASISGHGSQPVKKGQWHGEEYTVNLHQKAKVEYVVAGVPAGDVINAIADAIRTGEKDDGKIFVLSVESAVQVRTGKEGETAV